MLCPASNENALYGIFIRIHYENVSIQISYPETGSLSSRNPQTKLAQGFGLTDKLEFGGQWPLTMRYGPRWSNDILLAPRPVDYLALRMEFDKLDFVVINQC